MTKINYVKCSYEHCDSKKALGYYKNAKLYYNTNHLASIHTYCNFASIYLHMPNDLGHYMVDDG